MRALRNLVAAVAAAITLGGAAFWLIVRPWWHRWGVDPAEAVKQLPGDDIVPTPSVVDTRGITIDAPPSAVWPWLVQMGFDRAGWYSYDAMDMKGASAREIRPELQTIAVGELIPTHPGGGFKVRVLEPDHALVLYLDSALMTPPDEAAGEAPVAETPANLRLGGALLGNAQPAEFGGTWAFVLEPIGDGQTRLLERFRMEFRGGDRPWTRLTMPAMGFGVFAMMRKQMLGIRDRAEAAVG